MSFLGGSDDKEPICNVGDPGLIPGLGKSLRGREWHLTPVFLPASFFSFYAIILVKKIYFIFLKYNVLLTKQFRNFRQLFCCCSVTKPCLTLQAHGLQHTRLPCPPLLVNTKIKQVKTLIVFDSQSYK